MMVIMVFLETFNVRHGLVFLSQLMNTETNERCFGLSAANPFPVQFGVGDVPGSRSNKTGRRNSEQRERLGFPR